MDNNWSEYLTNDAGGQIDGTGMRIAFDDAQMQRDALKNGAITTPLLHLGLIRASGEDATAFLQNLLSNNAEKLRSDEAQWTSLNTPKGRMLSNFLLWRAENGWLLALSRDLCATMLKKLSFYVLRSKVKLEDVSGTAALIGVAGPESAALLHAAAFPAPAPLGTGQNDAGQVIGISKECFIIATESACAAGIFRKLRTAGGVSADSEVWRLAMIRHGLPLLTAATQELFIAQMLNFDAIGGIRSGKGCYPGQEIITRIRSQGKIKQRLYRIVLPCGTPPPAGAELYSPGMSDQPTGTIVNAAPFDAGHCEALAIIRIACADAGNIRLGSQDGPAASIVDLPYAYDVT